MQPSTLLPTLRTSPTSSHTIKVSNASSTSSTPFPASLPTEILTHILDLATIGLEPLERQATRIIFSKVSRAWYLGSRDASSEVVVDGSQRAKRLSETLVEENKLDGGTRQLIKSLILLDEGPEGGTERGKRFALLVGALHPPSSRVTCVTFFLASALCTNQELLSSQLIKELVHLTSLKKFALRGSAAFGRVLGGHLRVLLSQWKRLEHLDLSACSVEILPLRDNEPRKAFLGPQTRCMRCSYETISKLSPLTQVQELHICNAYSALDDIVSFTEALASLVATVTTLTLPPSLNHVYSKSIGDFLHATLGTLKLVKNLVLPLSIVEPLTILSSLSHLDQLEHLELLAKVYTGVYKGLHPAAADVAAFVASMGKLKRLVVSDSTRQSWDTTGNVDDVQNAAEAARVELVVL